MALINKSDIKRLTREEAEKKLRELESAMLELEGEGKRDKKRPLRKTIARIKTHLTNLLKKGG